MKIVHSISNLNFSSGGPVRAIIDLSQKLADRGHEVRIVTYENGRMALVDDASNWSMELGHFGDVGKNRFAELIAALPPSARLN